jgi:hypothetical protein
MHRLAALREFGNDPRFATLPVSVISNPHGKPPLDFTYVIMIAAHLNVAAHLIGKQSLADRVHMTTSYIGRKTSRIRARRTSGLWLLVEAADFLDVQSAVRNRCLRVSVFLEGNYCLRPVLPVVLNC